MLCRSFAICVLLLVTCLRVSSADSSPFDLVHSLFTPSAEAQANVREGWSVALDGNLAALGTPNEDRGMIDTGTVKIFNATSGALIRVLGNPNPVRDDYFGWSVGLSGNRVVVGAYLKDLIVADTGVAYVYDLAGTNPAIPSLTLTNPRAINNNDQFGYSVAISGNRVAVGAWLQDIGAAQDGAVYVYDLAGAAPAMPSLVLTNPEPSANDNFGNSVALDGPRLVVGAYRDSVGASRSGSTYVYDLSGATPRVPIATLRIASPGASDEFGFSVSISGQRVVVGAPGTDVGTTDSGSAFVFDLASQTPTVPAFILNNPEPAGGDGLGRSVSILGTRVLVGAPLNDATGFDCGSAYLYDLSGTNPVLPTVMMNGPSGISRQFGRATALSGPLGLIGTPFDSVRTNGDGSAYVYDFGSLTPDVPVTNLYHASPPTGFNFGTSIAFNGRWVLVGAHKESDHGNFVGHAYVYDLFSATPTVPAYTLGPGLGVGEPAFGRAIAINGTRIFVGATGIDAGAQDSGRVFIFDLTNAVVTEPVMFLNHPAPVQFGQFGYSMASSGHWLAIGDVMNRAYVYDLNSITSGVPSFALSTINSGLAMSGSRLMNGTNVYDLDSASPTNPVFLLNYTNFTLSQLMGMLPAISGERAAIGLPNAGQVLVYNLAGSTPEQPVTNIFTPVPAGAGGFGGAVALSGSFLVVGEPQRDAGATDAGGAFIFDLASATPRTPIATIYNPNPFLTDWFGNVVAIDGSTVIVGAPLASVIAFQQGAAYVFKRVVPQLSLAANMSGAATLSWSPTNLPGFLLQYTDSLSATNWLTAPSGTSNPVTVSTTNRSRFYRLAQP